MTKGELVEFLKKYDDDSGIIFKVSAEEADTETDTYYEMNSIEHVLSSDELILTLEAV